MKEYIDIKNFCQYTLFDIDRLVGRKKRDIWGYLPECQAPLWQVCLSDAK